MASSQLASTNILWQSENHDVSLIDIPRSIASAQGTFDQPCNDALLSAQPQEQPYQTNEPKSAAARAKLVDNTVDADLHSEYAKLLESALGRVRSACDRPWCLHRNFVQSPTKTGNKRALNTENGNDDEGNHKPKDEASQVHTSSVSDRELPSEFLSTLSRTSLAHVHGVDSDETMYDSTTPSSSRPQRNERSRSKLSIAHPGDPTASFDFLIPPMASLVLGPCSDPQTLHRSVRAQAQELESPKNFDLILLDPPWPNRSVKRTHKTANSTYSTAQSLDDLYHLIMGMDLDMLMSGSCLVAMWITNKPAVRELVLGEDGLFDCWGIGLVEEWIWLKTTINGEPVTPIDSVWRKPYEVLLIGRKRRQFMQPSGLRSFEWFDGRAIKRRVLVSVPDLHSRKPCLKDLLVPLVNNSAEYRALEVFARHLVAGWWSWGNECIKFNWEGCWRRDTTIADEDASRL